MEAIRYMVENPRAHLWRPSLTLLIFETLFKNMSDCQEERSAAALNVACGVEFLHTATLIVDDMFDHSHLRRGRPSCHIQCGNEVAQLAAVQLQNLSVRCFTCTTDLVLAQCASIEGMVSGEELDITEGVKEISEARLYQKHVLKSQMIVLAAEAGAIVAGADEEKKRIVKEYATALGFAYQCQDDLYDTTGDEALLGKPIGQDIGKVTAVSVFGERIHEVIKQHADVAKSAVYNIDVHGTLCAFTDIIITS